ncbi:hypothetical protein JL720_610 [Aureococcus anophagefferens]|nr:hypothetical protein JL720_610 [Aureococcus anophagefferens]
MRHALLRLAVVLDCAAALFPFHALKGRVDQSSWITQKRQRHRRGLFGRRVGGARQAPQRFITPSPAPRPAAEADATSAATSSWVALALLRQELDDMGVAQHEAEAAHTATRQELATALRNATALAADLAKSERLRRLVQREVQQLREVARNATSKALRAESSAKRATSRRPATRGAAMTPENPTAPGWLDAEDALSPEALAKPPRCRAAPECVNVGCLTRYHERYGGEIGLPSTMGGGFDMQSPNPIALRSRLAEDAFDAPLASKTAGCVAGRVSSKLAATPFAFRYLENLDLSGTVVGAPGIKALSRFLGCVEDCHLKSLRLDKCGLSDKVAALLFRGVERTSSLKVLSVSRNRVGDLGTAALAQCFHTSKTDLRDVNVSGNNVNGAPFTELCAELKHCFTLTRLDLSWNLLTKVDMLERVGGEAAPAAVALSYALEHNRVLQALNLNNCGLDAAAVETLAGGGSSRTRPCWRCGPRRATAAAQTPKCSSRSRSRTAAGCWASPRGIAKAEGKDAAKGHCWADAYDEVRFTFAVGASGAYVSTRPLFLHLECDEWRGDEMKPEIWKEGGDAAARHETVRRHAAHESFKEKGKERRSTRRRSERMVCKITGATIYRVLPPGRHWYFFSQDGRVLCADDHALGTHPRYKERRNVVDVAPRRRPIKLTDLTGTRPRSQDWTDFPYLATMIRSPHAWTLTSSFLGSTRRLDDEEKSEINRLGTEIAKINRAHNTAHVGERCQTATAPQNDRAYAEYELFDVPGRARAAAAEDWADMKLIKLRLIPETDAPVALEGLTEHYVLLAALFLHLCCTEDAEHNATFETSVTFDDFLKLGVDCGLVREPRNDIYKPDPAFDEDDDDDDDDDDDEFDEPDGKALPEALALLVANHVGPYIKAVAELNAPELAPGAASPELIGNNDAFRRELFYTEKVDAVFATYEPELRRMFQEHCYGFVPEDHPKHPSKKKRGAAAPPLDMFGPRAKGEDDDGEDNASAVPRLAFRDYLELMSRSGIFEMRYLKRDRENPRDGVGRGRLTMYEMLADVAKSRLLPIDDHVAMAENHDLAFGDFLEAVGRAIWRLQLLDVDGDSTTTSASTSFCGTCGRALLHGRPRRAPRALRAGQAPGDARVGGAAPRGPGGAQRGGPQTVVARWRAARIGLKLKNLGKKFHVEHHDITATQMVKFGHKLKKIAKRHKKSVDAGAVEPQKADAAKNPYALASAKSARSLFAPVMSAEEIRKAKPRVDKSKKPKPNAMLAAFVRQNTEPLEALAKSITVYEEPIAEAPSYPSTQAAGGYAPPDDYADDFEASPARAKVEELESIQDEKRKVADEIEALKAQIAREQAKERAAADDDAYDDDFEEEKGDGRRRRRHAARLRRSTTTRPRRRRGAAAPSGPRPSTSPRATLRRGGGARDVRRGAEAFAPHGATRATIALRAVVAETMPESLADVGCDEALWKGLPFGAKKDLTRFAADPDLTDYAAARIETMKAVREHLNPDFLDADWDEASWNEAVKAREAVSNAEAAVATKKAKESTAADLDAQFKADS